MSKFKREPRYIVLKCKDIDAYLSSKEAEALLALSSKIHRVRQTDGKVPFNAVVVEQDWPEFEPTWAAIEARMSGKPSPLDALRALARQLGDALKMCEHPVQLGVLRAACPSRLGPDNSCWCGRTSALAAFERAKKEGLL
jgi:hypothetical protein